MKKFSENFGVLYQKLSRSAKKTIFRMGDSIIFGVSIYLSYAVRLDLF